MTEQDKPSDVSQISVANIVMRIDALCADITNHYILRWMIIICMLTLPTKIPHYIQFCVIDTK